MSPKKVIMNSRFLLVPTLIGVLALAGCAAPARVDQMVASVQPSQRVNQSPLKNSVAVADVTGGKETNPMWKSNVGSAEFSEALDGSLRAAGLLAPSRQGGLYTLTAHLENLDQPAFGGFNMTVSAFVRYTVVERKTGKTVFNRTISPPYTATMGDAVLGVTRLKLANEGAVRTNISQLIDELLALKIEGVTVAPSVEAAEEKLKELKRLKDAGLITNDVYLERQKVILNGG